MTPWRTSWSCTCLSVRTSARPAGVPIPGPLPRGVLCSPSSSSNGTCRAWWMSTWCTTSSARRTYSSTPARGPITPRTIAPCSSTPRVQACLWSRPTHRGASCRLPAGRASGPSRGWVPGRGRCCPRCPCRTFPRTTRRTLCGLGSASRSSPWARTVQCRARGQGLAARRCSPRARTAPHRTPRAVAARPRRPRERPSARRTPRGLAPAHTSACPATGTHSWTHLCSGMPPWRTRSPRRGPGIRGASWCMSAGPSTRSTPWGSWRCCDTTPAGRGPRESLVSLW
mmetsp:Transcript_26110/g.87437  ORF Transcript_26110/g.87437 Transcript_26110/m.87437 type:complete len:284 (-) Transcript_26110:2141-2992(-)